MNATRASIAASTLLLAACAPVASMREAFTAPVQWDFILATGGFATGQPRLDQNVIWLPLDIDLSGRSRITHEPVLQETGVMCRKVEANVQPNRIYSLVPYAAVFLPPESYDVYLSVYSVEETGVQQPSCVEVPVPIPAPGPFQVTPTLSNPTTFRLWYRDSAFRKHLIDEFII